eukprot:gene6943-11106_t
MGNESSTPIASYSKQTVPFTSDNKKSKKKRKSLITSVVNDEEFFEAISTENLLKSNVDLTLDFGDSKQLKIEEPKYLILILGSSEAGKSTLVNQIRRHATTEGKFDGSVFYTTYKDDLKFKQNEIEAYRKFIQRNIFEITLDCFKLVMKYKLSLNDINEKFGNYILENLQQFVDNENNISSLIIKKLIFLWEEESMKKVFDQYQNLEFHYPDGCSFFLQEENLKRFDTKNQLSITEEDLIHCYRKTNIMSKTSFQYKDEKISIIDFEGKIKKEKFENIMGRTRPDIVVYVISLTEYQWIDEAEGGEILFKNSKAKFDAITKHEDLKSLPWIILFNKIDILEEKIKKFPLNNYFDDYVDQEPVEFIVGKFIEKIEVMNEKLVISMFSPNDILITLTTTTSIFLSKFLFKIEKFNAKENIEEIRENLYLENILHNWGKLREKCEKQLKLDPENITFLSYKLFALSELQLDDEIEEFNTITEFLLSKESEDPYELYLLSQVNLTFGSSEKGLEMLKKSVEKNCSEALLQYGILLLDGHEGVKVNKKEGIKLLKKAKNMGNKEALLALSHFHQETDPEKSFLFAMEANEMNYPPALKYLSNYYFNGIGIEPNGKLAFEYLEKSAEKGDSQSIHMLSNYYLEQQDFEKSLIYLNKAADNGFIEPLSEIAKFHLYGLGTVEKNVKLGIEYLEKAMKKGSPDAMAVYGELLMSGGIVEKNVEKARELFSNCGTKGSNVCNFYYGICLIKGIGGKSDFEFGKKLVELAAEQGNQMAIFLLQNNIPFDQYYPEEWTTE